jgi:hypothetical protein
MAAIEPCLNIADLAWACFEGGNPIDNPLIVDLGDRSCITEQCWARSHGRSFLAEDLDSPDSTREKECLFGQESCSFGYIWLRR